MSLDWMNFLLEAAPTNFVAVNGVGLILLIGAGVMIGAIAALAGQRVFKNFIQSLGWRLSAQPNEQERERNLANSAPDSTDSMEWQLETADDTHSASTATTVTVDASQENGSQGNGSQKNNSLEDAEAKSSSSQRAIRGTAERLGKVARSAKSAMSSDKTESSNGAAGKSSQESASSQLSKPESQGSDSSISRYERAEKKMSNGSSRQSDLASMGNQRKMNASKPNGSRNSPYNGHTNGSGNETLRSVLQSFVASHRGEVTLTVGLLVADLLLWILPHPAGYLFIEVPISLGVAIAISWLGSQLFREFFDGYLLNAAVREGRKLNSELLILAKFAANGIIILVAVVAFAQTHQINIFGIVASLGIGGLAVAFAAQKTLEQLLGGIVIYLDRPFVVDDYVGLPDGTFGRVESIGLRSTKVRTSGKGTLMIVPNSVLTQINIENFTGAKKVMSIVYLDLYRLIPDDEKALIRQVILESTSDIFGIDSRSTDVTFRHAPKSGDRTQVQITFFILGSGEVSMDLRRQVLDLANQNMTQQLLDYGLRFDLEEPTIYVDSPITI